MSTKLVNGYHPDAPNTLESAQGIAEKIIHLLGIYPIISPSMLQVGLGPQIPPRIWRPVLEMLIVEGKVSRSEIVMPTPFQQHRSYTKLALQQPLN